eukprot:9808966-Ditylum_brightwellii.AAC.1
MINLNLEVKDGLLALGCHYPSKKDLLDLPQVWLTSNKLPWDPSVLEEDSSITVPSCWDDESEFPLATNEELDSPEEINQFGEYHLQNQQATLFLVHAVTYLTTTAFNSFQNITKRVVSHSSKPKAKDYESVRPLLGWLPLEVVKRTFACTTQLAMGSTSRPWQHNMCPTLCGYTVQVDQRFWHEG